MSKWQPIETAPKDGRLILLFPSRCWCEDVNCDAEVGYWDRDMEEWSAATACCAEDYEGPTHWLPLPDPPEVAVEPPRPRRPEVGRGDGK